ncbi:hypothetical protein [Lentibacillus salicampi]|uniref:Uncharacterized protein n=1 Tax=Lentibacillus salicampi TaxID=175306 RepID=A0A4Y9A912_9BACI|nr:hypothetical protein [Lentibacillus salicampi]TFJ92339.1 hypothetical protein E4U82_12865 [Lentibacillus salicampi]
MNFQQAPHGGLFKLVYTKEYAGDIRLYVMVETDDGMQKRAYSWSKVSDMHHEGLRHYLLSLEEGIVSGLYDIDKFSDISHCFFVPSFVIYKSLLDNHSR